MGDGGKGSEAQEEDEHGFHGLWWFLGENVFKDSTPERNKATARQAAAEIGALL